MYSYTSTGEWWYDDIYIGDVPKEDQTITFPALAAKTYGDADYAPGATALVRTCCGHSSSNSNVATIVSNQIHITGAGTATIYADQAGDATYNAAPQVSRTLTVNWGRG
ncbi:MAG: hypothetical protein R2751_19450 [Bacteroidales bacterium]